MAEVTPESVGAAALTQNEPQAMAPDFPRQVVRVLNPTEVGNVLRYLSHMKQMDDVELDSNDQATFDHGRELIFEWLSNCLYEY